MWEPEARHHFVDAYRDRVVVQRCVDLIAKSFTQVDLKAYRGDTEIEEHPILDFFYRPCPRDPALMFFEWTAKWSQIVGEWYWELIPARGGGIAEAYPLRSHLVRVQPGTGGKVKGYVYDPNATGETREFEAAVPGTTLKANSVISGRFANPLDDWYGMPPLRGAKDDIISEYYAIRYDHRFFRNSARPDIVLSFKEKLSRDQRKANKDEWQDFKGVDNAHKAAVMDGDVSVEKLTSSQRDVEYLEGRKLARENECIAFGVPPVLAGIFDRATYSNFREAEPIFWKSTMLPLLDFMASWANCVIVPFFDGVDRIEFDTSMIQALQESENEKVERLVRAYHGGLMHAEEGREELDLEPMDDPETRQLVRPFSLTPYAGEGVAEEKAAKEEANAAMAAAIASGNGNQPVQNDDQAEPFPNGQMPMKSKAKNADAYGHARENLLDNFTENTARRIAAAVRPAGKEVEAIVAGKSKVGDLERELEQYGWGALGAKMEAIIGSMHFAVWGESSLATATLLGIEVTLGDDAPQVQALLRELMNRPDGIRTVEGRIKEDVIEEVRYGISKGIPTRGIATGGEFDVGPPGAREDEKVAIKGVRGVFEEYQTWQAERIARTEAVNAYNLSSTLVMRDAGVEYVDVVDGMEDAACADANGARWTLDEAESNPYEHPNCTRMFLPVIDVPKQRIDVSVPVYLPEQKAAQPVTHVHVPEQPPAHIDVNVHPSVVVKDGPREIVRDESGRATGSRPIEED